MEVSSIVVYGRIMNQTVVVEQSLHVKNEHEISGFCFTPQDGNSILSSISAAEWFLYPHSYEDKIQCLSNLFFNTVLPRDSNQIGIQLTFCLCF